MVTFDQRQDFFKAVFEFGYTIRNAAAYAGITPETAYRLSAKEDFSRIQQNSKLSHMTDDEISLIFYKHTPAQLRALFGLGEFSSIENHRRAVMIRTPVPEDLQRFLDPNLDVDMAFESLRGSNQ